MIAVDTNILVYAHRRDSAFHERARDCLRALAEGTDAWAIPWPCVHEFLSIVTSPRVFKIPTPLEAALLQLDLWRASPTLRMLGEEDGYWETLVSILSSAKIMGPRIHDARIAALVLLHGATELLSADRDFSRFPSLNARNPL